MTTFEEMKEIMLKNGWISLTPQDYQSEKRKKKGNTARIGTMFFKLKELSLKDKIINEGKPADAFVKHTIVIPIWEVIINLAELESEVGK